MSASFTRWSDVLPEPMLLVETSTARVLALNRAAARLLQRAREELVGALLAEIFSTPPEALHAYLRQAARGQQLLPGALHLGEGRAARRLPCHGARTPDGTVLIRLRLDSEPASRFLVLNQKLDELARENARRRRAEAALRASEQRLQAILENSPQAIFLKDQRGVYLLSNQQFERFCGHPPERIQSLSDEVLFPPELAARFAALDRAALASDQPVTEELTTRRGGELKTWLHTRFRIHDPARDEVLLCGILQDLTSHKQLEIKYKRTERAVLEAQRLESLGVLTGGIAHDFNNLLTGLITNARMASDALPAGSFARECIEDVLMAGEHATQLCAQLLAYVGRSSGSPKAVNLKQLTRELLHLLEHSLPSGATLRLSFAPDLPLIVAVPCQLQQVLMNLIINAAQALPDGSGTIEVSARRDGDAVQLEVSDNGCGMDERQQARIFEPLFTTREGGHGLGLSAVQGIIRRHSGTITVKSTPGAGSTFTIRVPVDAALEQPAHPTQRLALVTRGATTIILLASGDLRSLSACKEQLEQAGYHVLTAASEREVLAHFSHRAASAIGALVLDSQLLQPGGLNVLDTIRVEYPELPVLLTGEYKTAGFPRAPVSGLDFLQRPFSPGELLEKLSQLRDAGPDQRAASV